MRKAAQFIIFFCICSVIFFKLLNDGNLCHSWILDFSVFNPKNKQKWKKKKTKEEETFLFFSFFFYLFRSSSGWEINRSFGIYFIFLNSRMSCFHRCVCMISKQCEYADKNYFWWPTQTEDLYLFKQNTVFEQSN